MVIVPQQEPFLAWRAWELAEIRNMVSHHIIVIIIQSGLLEVKVVLRSRGGVVCIRIEVLVHTGDCTEDLRR